MTGIRTSMWCLSAPVAVTLVVTGAALAEIWRHAFEETVTDVQGVYAQKFKEEVETIAALHLRVIVIGSRGLGSFEGYFLSRITHKVTGPSECLVLVV